jgi:hypothetical protein
MAFGRGGTVTAARTAEELPTSKGKRKKIVHPTDMVAHLWAHQTQDEARNPHGNFYFEGNTIYSYGSHFPIARHMGENTILLTTRGYSSTTAGHISDVRRAIPDTKTVFNVVNVTARDKSEHLENFSTLVEEITAIREHFEKSLLKKAELRRTLEERVKHANAYSAEFKLRKRVPLVKTKEVRKAIKISEEKRKVHDARVNARREAQQAKYYAEVKQCEAELARDSADLIAAWCRGDAISAFAHNTIRELPVMLRTRDGNLETSKGAIVPLADAALAFGKVVGLRRLGRSWKRNGEQIYVGDFQIDSISETGDVVAGCHRIHWDEIERFAKSQNWL